tara:strand:+ start:415 stop:750 length:336 start_codon:yes stop_codon:yes gene_type:complete
MIEINHEVKNDTLIINPVGRLDGLTSKKFMEDTEGLIKLNSARVIINLDSLDYISSEGLRSILTTAKTIKSQGGKFGLCTPLDGVREVLEISGFGAMLGVYESLELALSSV